MRPTIPGLVLGVLSTIAGCGSNTSLGNAVAAAGSGGASGETAWNAGGATSVFSTTVPGAAVLGDLSDADYQSLCSDDEATANASGVALIVNELSCRFNGIVAAVRASSNTDAELQAACHSVYDVCIKAISMAAWMCAKKPSAACLATVAEYEACLTGTMAELNVELAIVTRCDDLTQANLSTATNIGNGATAEPPSCVAVDHKCPEFGPMSSPGLM